MKNRQKARRIIEGIIETGPAKLILFFAVSLIFAVAPVRAQRTVNLPQRVIEAKQTDYVYTQNPGTPQVIQIKSANQSVATAGAYGVGGVQIVAVNPGKTTVEFFDNDARVLYRLPVWVTAPNPTGAGNSGYDPQRIQLDQVVMRPRTTQNVAVPGGGVPQISGVTSSNPGVAKARTNTVNTIQIYSFATNGDTFINLTDSATNRNFQVHVYVRDNAPGPVGGPGPKPKPHPNPGPNPNSNPKPNPNPNPNPDPDPNADTEPITGKLDRCLVGRWVSESESILNGTVRGGNGAIVTVKADRSVSIDYNGMKNVEFYNDFYKRWDSSQFWKGTAVGSISADKGRLTVDRVDRSNVTTDILDANGQSMSVPGWNSSWSKTLGGILPPTTLTRISYTCSDSTWTIIQTVNKVTTTYTLKR